MKQIHGQLQTLLPIIISENKYFVHILLAADFGSTQARWQLADLCIIGLRADEDCVIETKTR